MTTSKPIDIREFWITEDMESVKFERGATAGMAFDSKQSDDEEYIHVIEYRAVEQLKAENEDLKNTLNGIKNCKAGDFVVYHPVKNPDADNIFETINKLREQVKDYEQKLNYYGTELFGADAVGGKNAREVLKKWSGV